MTDQPKKTKTFSFKYVFHDFIKITGGPLGLLWFRPKHYYESERAKKHIKGGAMIVSNHIGMVDPMYIMLGIWYRRERFLAAKDLFFEKPFSRFVFKNFFLCIPIDRENFGLAAFREIVSHLKSGELLVMFPEGHVNQNDSGVSSFKAGMVLMAQKSGCPIIPVYIQRRKHFYNRLKMVIGDPIDINELSEKLGTKDSKVIAEYLRQKEEYLETLIPDKKKAVRK